MKIEERVQNLKENMQNDETERSFQFREKLETLFHIFSVSQNDRNLA